MVSLFIRGSEVSEGDVEMKLLGGHLSTKQIVGKDSSMMLARRSGGYHSKPHLHNCEQLNYVVSGAIWIFIENQAFHLCAGDFLRIPANAVHWAWNRSEEDCELLECHAPPLDILPREQVEVLLDEDEDPQEIRWVENIFVDEKYLEREADLIAALEGST